MVNQGVIVPKYRKKKLYGTFRERAGRIIKDLCRQRGVEFIEGRLMPDHIQRFSRRLSEKALFPQLCVILKK